MNPIARRFATNTSAAFFAHAVMKVTVVTLINVVRHLPIVYIRTAWLRCQTFCRLLQYLLQFTFSRYGKGLNVNVVLRLYWICFVGPVRSSECGKIVTLAALRALITLHNVLAWTDDGWLFICSQVMLRSSPGLQGCCVSVYVCCIQGRTGCEQSSVSKWSYQSPKPPLTPGGSQLCHTCTFHNNYRQNTQHAMGFRVK